MDRTYHVNQIYLMVVNGLSDPAGSAADCLQEIKLNFAFPAGISAVDHLDPLTGLLQTVALPLVSGRRQLALNLIGGDGALFKFSNGAPFVGVTPIAAKLNVSRQAGVPTITVQGAIGSRYQLEVSPGLTNWSNWTSALLPTSSYSLQDPDGTNLPQRFYRARNVP